VPSRKRTPRIPSENRTWLAIGAGWAPLANVSVDIGYAHLFAPDADIDLRAGETGNTFRGNLSGSVETSIDIVSVQASLRF
jgi:long-chain fatty acid transport protein